MTKPKIKTKDAFTPSKIADSAKPDEVTAPVKKVKKEKLPFKPGTEDVMRRPAVETKKLAKTNVFRLNLLDNWMELNATAKDMGEDELAALIIAERKGQCRPNILLRLHGRYNKLRGLREKSEIMQKL